MVATRMERKAKLALLTQPAPVSYVRIVRDPERVEHSTTNVNHFTVKTLGNTSRAMRNDGEPGAIVDIYGPGDINHADAHTLAVRYLRRRGPDYRPGGTRVIVALDARGRIRHTEKIS